MLLVFFFSETRSLDRDKTSPVTKHIIIIQYRVYARAVTIYNVKSRQKLRPKIVYVQFVAHRESVYNIIVIIYLTSVIRTQSMTKYYLLLCYMSHVSHVTP